MLGAAAVAAAVLVVGLAVLFNRSDKAAVTVGTGRVDWGMTAVVRIEPDPWTDQRRAVSETVAALRTEAERLDIAGMEIRSTGTRELTLKIPGAEATSQLRFLLMIPRVRVLDYETSVLAEGSRASDLVAAARRATKPGQPTHYIVVGVPGRGVIVTPNRFQPTLRGARADQRSLGGPSKADVLAVPDGLTVVTDIRIERGVASQYLYLVRERPLARGSEIQTRLSTSPALRVGVAAIVVDRARRLTTEKTRRVIAVSTDSGPRANPPAFVGIGLLDLAAREISFESRQNPLGLVRGPMTQPNLGSRLRLHNVVGYGPQPLGRYPRTDLRWPWAPGVPAENFVAPISIDIEGRRATVVIQKRNQSAFFSAIRVAGSSADAGVQSGTCYLGLGAPALSQACMFHDLGERLVFAGRVRDDVLRIDATLPSGQVVQAHLENGWYMLSWRKQRSLRDMRLPALAARDADGTVVGRVPATMSILSGP